MNYEHQKGGNAMPTLKNILVNPDARLIKDEIIGPEPDRRQAVINVTGLLCFL